ncbi:hypothetical protein GCK72_014264 [Caenorhabditis remanei]|uniref:Uncharacterized protein n=1 Tax=Caenorhabditis remanei TaxID=31234 RepID=A0A6A5GRJ3_CAERE|nr:hypothetical protein GCK72_014264 [Caenorhabditis remanei]KAF1757807.1 hypothetical protein GCK72_014264 [Caenorhabditis remanei]
MIDRRNKRSLQIFLLLITFLICSGAFFYFYSNPEDEVPDYFPPEVKQSHKTEREIALEKVRQLQQNGFANVASETFYDDQSKNVVPGDVDNSGFENAVALFQKLNSSIVQESPVNEHGEKMTADSFYDEKLKQKQEEDGVGDHNPANQKISQNVDLVSTNNQQSEQKPETGPVENNKQEEIGTSEKEIPATIAKNETISSDDIIGKSEAVQSWIETKQNPRKTLSEVESPLRVDEAAEMSQRRNPKFEAFDPEIERLQNRVHQFKFVQ